MSLGDSNAAAPARPDVAPASPEGSARRGRGRPARAAKPRRFGDLPSGAWGRIAKRTFDQFRADGVTNLAAALTYRAILSLFPGLIALVALLGLLGQYPETFDAVLRIVGQVAPTSAVDAVRGPLRGVLTDKGGAGALLGVGLLGAIWAASGYIGTFSWAANVLWEAERGRSWYRQWPFDVALTIVTLFLLTFLLIALVLSGPIARQLGSEIGVGSTIVHVWDIAKWPAMAIVVALLIGGLYYLAPNIHPPPVRFLTPGTLLAVVAWVAMSIGFAIYVANFDTYNKTYGTLGAIVTFLVWVWWTNIAILLGVELDSEIERERQLAAGQPGAEQRIQLPLRQS